MTKEEIIQKLHITMTDARGQESHFESWMTLNEGICDAIDALKALDKQEPVAWMDEDGDVLSASVVSGKGLRNIPLYTTPPQRTWVGLTDEERNDCLVDADPCECLADPEAEELMRCIEAKLKEKNT